MFQEEVGKTLDNLIEGIAGALDRDEHFLRHVFLGHHFNPFCVMFGATCTDNDVHERCQRIPLPHSAVRDTNVSLPRGPLRPLNSALSALQREIEIPR